MSRKEQFSVGELTVDHIFGGGIGPQGQGDTYYLDFSAGPGYSGKKPGTPFNNLEDAENALTANQNDILVYLQSSTAGAFDNALLTWDKSYTHLIGFGARTRIAQRARVFAATAQTVGNLLISASGCTFENLYIFNGSSSDTDLYNVKVTGGRNHFKNVHFAGLGHATMAARAGAKNLLLDGAEENLFEDCTIGLTTVTRTAANAVLTFDSNAHRNLFERCRIISAAETVTIPIVALADTSAVDDFNEFYDSLFFNFWSNHVGNLNQVFSTGVAGITKNIILRHCTMAGCDAWQDNDAAAIYGDMPTATAQGGKVLEISEA